jgi:hypothetical protein
VLPRVLLPSGVLLLAACPTFSYGPEAYEVEVESSACVEAGLRRGCSRFRYDNGEIYTSSDPQLVQLRVGFESDERNLAYLRLDFSVPGMPLVRRTCALPTGPTDASLTGLEDLEMLGEVDEGFGCALVVLADASTADDVDATRTAQGILEIQAALLAAEPGPYAISALLVDDNDLQSSTVRWQFTVREPERE